MTHVELHLQDPGADEDYLLERLLQASSGADRGGGIFAWTTAAGIDLLLGDDLFRAFARSSVFRMLIGIDSITNERALAALVTHQKRLSGLSVDVLLHETEALFHPKFAWFVDGQDLTLIVGSGNATRGGLRSNWEAFTTTVVQGTEATAVEQQIEGWIARHQSLLRPPDDPAVVARAKQNAGDERRLRPGGRTRDSAKAFSATDDVLVAELPAGERWKQANFKRTHFEGFFGAHAGSKQRVLLQRVDGTGLVGELKSRPPVVVQSQNYRLELASKHGEVYPSGTDRPIAIFLKLGSGLFLYELLMPGHPSYSTVSSFLATHQLPAPSRELRRAPTTAGVLRAAWPGSALWSVEPPPT